MNDRPGPETGRLERRLFLLLLGLVLLVFVFLVVDRRLPRGHDTFLSYSTAFFALCHASQGGGSIHWIPYLAQGSEPAAGVSVALLPTLWPDSGRALEGLSALWVFYFRLVTSEILLLVGTWMLARRRFADPRIVFLVSAAVVGGNLWIDQPGNAVLVAPFPLLICWIEDFVERGNRLRLLLAAHLLSFQVLGGYLSLLLVPALGLYFGIHVLLHPSRWKGWILGLRPAWTDVLWAAGVGSAIVLPLAGLRAPGELVFSSAGRSAQGSVALDGFLTHGGILNPLRYLDAVVGLSPSLDVTVFCGTITMGLAVAALLLRPGREVLHLAVVCVLLVLLSTGFLSMVAGLTYGIPKLGYVRHLTMAAPFARFMLAFLAGYGLERLSQGRLGAARLVARAGVAAACVSAALALLSLLPREVATSTMKMLETGHPGFSFRHDLAAESGAGLLTGAAAVAAGVLATALLLGRSGRFPIGSLAALLIATNTVHVFGWKLSMIHWKTIRMTPEQHALQKIGPLQYLPRRTRDPADAPRYASLAPVLWPYGTEHGMSDPYFLVDLPVPRGRITVWQRPLDDLLRAWSGGPPQAGAENRLHLPDSPPSIPRVVGLDTDKLQVFRRAHPVPGGEETARLMKHPDFRGDLLFVPGEGPAPSDLAANDRLPTPCEVVQFDADRVVVRTRAPEGAWLAYADVWHPRWRATVNGRPATVERANLAYKAVRLQAGDNEVALRFDPDPVREAVNRATAAAGLFWTLLVAALAVRLAAGRAPIVAKVAPPA